ncbi:MAG: OadG family transporter subunit [Nitrospinaceae bacterium]
MEANVITSLSISILAITVIFVVLTILIFTIRALVHFIPFQEAPEPSQKEKAASGGEMDEHIAAITASLSAYLGKSPGEFHIINIKTGK